jgi:uncharacterized caspase-like protein
MKARMFAIVGGLLLSIFTLGDALAAGDERGALALGSEKKVALVMANSAYVHAVALPNPVNDGKLIADTLRKSGFSVLEGSDLDKSDMGKLLDRFTEEAFDADIALVYYAGHGLQVDGHNYLIPVDAVLEKAAHLQTRAIPVQDLLAALPPDPAAGIVILDACRDNPLARTLAAALPKSRSMGAGLAPVQASGSSHNAGGLLIAYATDPGAVAYDGNSEHSPYTAALSRNLATPGLEIQSALTRVRAEVSQATNGAQRPWHNASLAREVFIGGLLSATPADTPTSEPAVEPPVGPVAGPEVDWDVERTVWEEASKRNTIAHYEFYLKQYPEGRFAGLARLGVDQLKQAVGVPTAEAPSMAPAAETRTADVQPVPTTPLPATPAPAAQSAIDQPSQGDDGSSTKTASASPDDKPAVSTEAEKPLPGTPATEAELELDREGRIDLQLRLSALQLYTGGFDGSLGPRSRAAIGAWQRQNGIVETTFLTTEQHLLIVAQTEPMMAEVRARYQSQKAATQEPGKTKKPVKATATKSTRTAAKTTIDSKPPTKGNKVASKLPCTTYDVVSQSYEPCKTATKPKKKVVASKLPCTVYDVVSQSYQPCKTATKPKKKVVSSKLPCTVYDVVSQSYERCK